MVATAIAKAPIFFRIAPSPSMRDLAFCLIKLFSFPSWASFPLQPSQCMTHALHITRHARLPEASSEEVRAAVLARISSLINGQAFNGVIPSFESAAGRLIGQHPAPAAFKKDPGLLLIGVDLDVEVWTCALCDFDCGLAMDSAMYHLNSELHRKRLQESAHLPAVKDKICTDFFQKLYGGSQSVLVDPSFWNLIPTSQIPPAAFSRLSLPFSLAEISKAISSLPKGKTPGPDGLPDELFRKFSPQFAPILDSLFNDSHHKLPPSMLQGRTVLIPKKGDATMVDNPRPITLMNTDYKILAICLANRLQPLLPSLIHHSQSAFIKSRRIGNTLNDTLDIFDWASAQGLSLLALTVDIRKAYDLVDREFLFSCLAHPGLPPLFIHWVRLMHTGTSTRISVNNFCGPSIPVRSGVRQGCPLAPLLFLCVIEVFHRHASCFLPGFPISRTQRRLMACYADDITIFLNSDVELQKASHALLSFASVLGEYPNWSKCSLIPFNFRSDDILHAGDIPIRQPAEFERILGIFVGSSGDTSRTWECALAKVKGSANLLANLHATASCRKNLASEQLNSVLTFPGRFQPPPSPTTKALDATVGNFLSSSKFRSAGRTTRLLTHAVIYNKVEHGGLGAIRPSAQIKALNAQRALRRFSPLPDSAVARSCVPLPFGLHGFLLHKDFISALPPTVPIRLQEEVRCLLQLPLDISPPRLEFWCILAEPVPFNRFILNKDGRPFGRLQHESFLLTKEVRVGNLVRREGGGARRLTNPEIMAQYPPSEYPCSRRIVNAVYDAIPREWWAALASSHSLVPFYAGDWVLMAADMFSPPRQAFEVEETLSNGSFYANLFDVSSTGRIGTLAAERRQLSPHDVVHIHVQDRWLCGSFCSGAGLAARFPLLDEGMPSLAATGTDTPVEMG
ncbi:unnamed protein product [Closterium sp. NIES-65]|nr:unnamed protein product [Closterium sp. NIES-65]